LAGTNIGETAVWVGVIVQWWAVRWLGLVNSCNKLENTWKRWAKSFWQLGSPNLNKWYYRFYD